MGRDTKAHKRATSRAQESRITKGKSSKSKPECKARHERGKLRRKRLVSKARLQGDCTLVSVSEGLHTGHEGIINVPVVRYKANEQRALPGNDASDARQHQKHHYLRSSKKVDMHEAEAPRVDTLHHSEDSCSLASDIQRASLDHMFAINSAALLPQRIEGRRKGDLIACVSKRKSRLLKRLNTRTRQLGLQVQISCHSARYGSWRTYLRLERPVAGRQNDIVFSVFSDRAHSSKTIARDVVVERALQFLLDKDHDNLPGTGRSRSADARMHQAVDYMRSIGSKDTEAIHILSDAEEGMPVEVPPQVPPEEDQEIPQQCRVLEDMIRSLPRFQHLDYASACQAGNFRGTYVVTLYRKGDSGTSTAMTQGKSCLSRRLAAEAAMHRLIEAIKLLHDPASLIIEQEGIRIIHTSRRKQPRRVTTTVVPPAQITQAATVVQSPEIIDLCSDD